MEDNTIRKFARSATATGRARWLKLVAGAWLLTASAIPAPAAEAADSAVIVMYHRFGEPQYPSTNIQLDQFEAHLRILAEDGYTVLPVPEIIAAIRSGRPLPDKTVGITIDDAYASFYAEAWPRLRDAGIPFTLFVPTDPVDEGNPDYMTWQQVRELRDAGVTIGGHSASHAHMAARSESFVADELSRSNLSFTANLGGLPGLFAYPFGEANQSLLDAVEEAGYSVAFGQQSGAVHSSSDMRYLPRFAINQDFGDADRFGMVTSTLALPVEDVTPRDPTLQANPPAFGFTLTEDLDGLDRLACYASGQGKAALERLGPRVEVRVAKAFGKGRARINCTAPGPQGRWYWFGMQFYVP